jgi:hypothetical protein
LIGRIQTIHNTMASDRKWAQMMPDIVLMIAAVRATLVLPHLAGDEFILE